MAIFLYSLPLAFSSSLSLSLPRLLGEREKPYVGGVVRGSHPVLCQQSSFIPVPVPSSLQQEGKARQFNFHPTVWEDSFIESLITYDATSIASITQRIDELKEKVHYMLSHADNPLQLLNLIDTIERLGLDYHFEKDIQSILQQLYQDCYIHDDSLHDVALRFRLLRQQGYNVSCDVFDVFKDKDGKFKQNLREDVNGLLSLYEASHLSLLGEDILDEALDFTTEHLKSISTHLHPSLSTHVEHALALPQHKNMPKLAARRFISYYETNDARNNDLLELAKLDFNLLQSCYRKEIKEVTKWKTDMDFIGKFPFARDRIVELCLWAIQMNFLPQFSQGRIAIEKYFNTFPIVDDIYEAYGTLDELELYNDAFARWDLSAMDRLPYHMKLSYQLIFNLCNEIEYISLKDRGTSVIHHLRKKFSDLSAGYLQEAKWFYNGYIPSMDEYLSNAVTTTHVFVVVIIAAVGMRELIPKEAFDFLLEESKLPWLVGLVVRFTDDLAPTEYENEQGDVAKSVQCYMKEHGVSEEVAHENIKHMLAEAWKGINQEIRQPNPLPKPFIQGLINLARVSETSFADGKDGLGDSTGSIMDVVNSLLFEPIPM